MFNVPSLTVQGLSDLYTRAYNWAYGIQDSKTIDGSQDNFKRAIEEKNATVLEYKFLDQHCEYSPLEYAIKIGDRESVSKLIEFGAKVLYIYIS